VKNKRNEELAIIEREYKIQSEGPLKRVSELERETQDLNQKLLTLINNSNNSETEHQEEVQRVQETIKQKQTQITGAENEITKLQQDLENKKVENEKKNAEKLVNLKQEVQITIKEVNETFDNQQNKVT